MPTLDTQIRAAELQRQLATLTGHNQATVRPYGKHLLIQMRRTDDAVDTVARITELARNTYSSAFRSYSGRWEPLPGIGTLAETAELVVTLLAPYLDPNT
jgi:hypothetical protein